MEIFSLSLSLSHFLSVYVTVLRYHVLASSNCCLQISLFFQHVCLLSLFSMIAITHLFLLQTGVCFGGRGLFVKAFLVSFFFSPTPNDGAGPKKSLYFDLAPLQIPEVQILIGSRMVSTCQWRVPFQYYRVSVHVSLGLVMVWFVHSRFWYFCVHCCGQGTKY